MPADLQAKYEEAFDAIDADGTGEIDKQELAAIIPGVTQEALAEAFTKFDADHDGSMGKEEYFDFVYGASLEQARIMMKNADSSGDGKLSKEELKAAFVGMEEVAEEAMASMDDDGSGLLSIDEVVDFLLEV